MSQMNVPMVGPAYKTPKGMAEPAERTVRWWGLRHALPQWLVEAVAIQRHANEELAEDTFAELCEQTVAMPLGAPKGKV